MFLLIEIIISDCWLLEIRVLSKCPTQYQCVTAHYRDNYMKKQTLLAAVKIILLDFTRRGMFSLWDIRLEILAQLGVGPLSSQILFLLNSDLFGGICWWKKRCAFQIEWGWNWSDKTRNCNEISIDQEDIIVFAMLLS